MAERLADAGPNLGVYKVHVEEIKEQDVNARVMAPEMFDRLTENIRREGRLEQLPFCVVKGNGFEMVSGHHRLRGARAAGLTEIFVLADERKLSRSSIVAKQIAHNRLQGEDDREILRRLYEEIETVDDKIETFLSAEDFDDVRQLEPVKIADLGVDLPFKHITLVFLPKAIEDLDALETFVKKLPRDSDTFGVVSIEALEAFRQACLKLSRKEDVRSMGAIVTRMLELIQPLIDDEPATSERPRQEALERAGAEDRPASA